MLYSIPSDSLVVSFDDLPTGLVGSATPPGVQVQRASNGTVVSARTQSGIDEIPAGSGNYVVSFVAPPELDDYLIVLDWDVGAVEPDTSEVEPLKVTESLPVVPSEMGVVADATKSHMGEVFDGLVESSHYGSGFVLRKIAVVKDRVMTAPPSTADEDGLHRLVVDYLGKLAALELVPAAISYWASQAQTESTGNDPVETTSYPSRLEALKLIQEALLRQTRRDEVVVASLLEAPRLRTSALAGPAIDEADDCRVTADPRDFPRFGDFPYSRRDRVVS